MDIRFLMQKKIFSGILQNCLIILSTKNILDFLLTHLKFFDGNLKDCQNKVLKI